MKNCQYVLDVETPFIKKLYDKEDNYKVELLTPYGILEELKKLQEENANLEAKLAESDENIKLLEQDRVVICNTMDMYIEKVEKLKQQLAEKEKEIENIKLCRCVNCTNEYEFMLEGLVEDLEKQIDKDNQDKISFAVEQLENCRLNLIKLLNKKRVYLDSSTTDEMDDLFDNQIKQLKEGK